MISLEVQSLVKRYGDHVVLNDINLSVSEGEFFVLLGPSGGGKSTILRVLCGIEKADAGRIFLAGREITDLPPRDRNIGMVFQDYGLYPHMNAYENIAYGLEARGIPKTVIDEKIKVAAEKLGMTALLQRAIVDLSGGEQQRVALARALAKDAALYLFDEPLSNLDPKLRAKARRDILMVHREKGKPTLYVTHDQTEALAIADRIGIVARGQLQQVGTAEELLQHPADLFVAGFLGSPPMNLLTASLSFEASLDQYRAQVSDVNTLLLPGKWKSILHAHNKEKLVIGIPPAAFFAPRSGDDGQTNAGAFLEGEIEDVEPLVGDVIVMLKIAPQVSISAIFQGVEEELFEIGNRLHVGIDSEQLCLFDPDTERALNLTA